MPKGRYLPAGSEKATFKNNRSAALQTSRLHAPKHLAYTEPIATPQEHFDFHAQLGIPVR
jgi:hypothetical protein